MNELLPYEGSAVQKFARISGADNSKSVEHVRKDHTGRPASIECLSVHPPHVHIIDRAFCKAPQIRALLKSHGIRLRTYVNWEDFLREGDPAPGCVLIRIDECDEDFELSEVLSSSQRNLPLIVASQGCGVQAAVQWMKQGAADVVEPYQLDSLIQSLDDAWARFLDSSHGPQKDDDLRKTINKLTPRQREIFDLLLHGLKNREIAHLKGLSIRTVEMHRANMMAALGISTMAGVILLGLNAGLRVQERSNNSASRRLRTQTCGA